MIQTLHRLSFILSRLQNIHHIKAPCQMIRPLHQFISIRRPLQTSNTPKPYAGRYGCSISSAPYAAISEHSTHQGTIPDDTAAPSVPQGRSPLSGHPPQLGNMDSQQQPPGTSSQPIQQPPETLAQSGQMDNRSVHHNIHPLQHQQSQQGNMQIDIPQQQPDAPAPPTNQNIHHLHNSRILWMLTTNTCSENLLHVRAPLRCISCRCSQ